MIAQFPLHPTPPYNFFALIAFMHRMPHPAVEHARNGAYMRVVEGEGWRSLVRVLDTGSIEAPELLVEVLVSQGDLDEVGLCAQLTHILDINGDRAAFFDYARNQPDLWRVVEPLIGLPLTRTATVFEALATVIIEQQIAWRAARRARHWLVSWGLRAVEHQGERYHAFPTPAQIAATDIETLKPLKITFKRMQLLIDIATDVASGAFDIESLTKLEADEAICTLLALKGIGPWTAAVTVGRALGHNHVVTANDVALQAAARWYFRHSDGRMDAAELVETFQPFNEFAGLAANYTLIRWVMDRY